MLQFENKAPLKGIVPTEPDLEVKYKMRKQAARKLGKSKGNA